MYIYIFIEVICLEVKLSGATSPRCRIVTDWDFRIHTKFYAVIAIGIFAAIILNDDGFFFTID